MVKLIFQRGVYHRINILSLCCVGDENCASVWSFSVASMVENDVEIDADDHNNSQNLLQNP